MCGEGGRIHVTFIPAFGYDCSILLSVITVNLTIGVSIQAKKTVYVGLGAIWVFRNPLGAWKVSLVDKGGDHYKSLSS